MRLRPDDITVTYGPSLHSFYRSLIVEFDHTVFDGGFILTEVQLAKLPLILPDKILSKLSADGVADAPGLLVELLKAFLGIKELPELAIVEKRPAPDRARLIVEYYSEKTARIALNASFLVVDHLKSGSHVVPPEFKRQLDYLISFLINRASGEILQGMIRSAKRRNIPLYPIEDSSFITLFGQGARSFMFNYAASEFNSAIGFFIQNDKLRSSNLLRKAGYPTTRQKVIHSLETCLEAADELGYPVVLKPLSQGGGRGVTADIRSKDQLAYAFREASKYSPDNILIEKHVDGNDHRITMSNGKFIGGAIRFPAKVVGDASHTVRELIDIENVQRTKPECVENKIKQLVIDDRVMRNLSKAQLSLDDIPKKGQTVLLGDIANRSVGGTLKSLNEKDFHPDYIEMAQDLCKLFCLDTIGIDFITPDISRSWREMGAIIEINAYPMAAPKLANLILENYFGKSNGRIETILVISNNGSFGRDIFLEKLRENKFTGYANKNYAELSSGKMISEKSGLFDHCLSLFLNKNCDAAVIEITPEEIVETGLPDSHFDLCIIDENSHINDVEINEKVQELTNKNNLQQWLSDYVAETNKQQ